MYRNPYARLTIILVVFLGMAVLPVSRAGADDMGHAAGMEQGKVTRAIAVVHHLKSQQVLGTVTFTGAQDGLMLKGEFMNLAPGSHGFHIHVYGDCTAPNEDSVGPHYMPAEHGEGYHGDLPMIEAGEDGRATVEARLDRLALTGPRSIIGRGLLVHGLDGSKIGCGVIGIDE